MLMMQLEVSQRLEIHLKTWAAIIHFWRDRIVDHGTCPGFLSIDEIAEKICRSKSAVRRAMRKLTSEGGIEEKKDGRITRYRVIITNGEGNEYLTGKPINDA